MANSLVYRIRYQRTALSGKLRRNRSLQLGAGILIAYIVISLLDLLFPQYIGMSHALTLFSFSNPDTYKVALAAPTPPTLSHGVFYIFGTTAYNIPIFPAILAAIPVDLGFAVAQAGVSAIIGVVFGVSATYLSRKLEIVLESLANVFISFPLLVSVLLFGLLFHFTLEALSLGIIIVLWAYYAQIARMLTLSIKGNMYVEAARASGASRIKVIFSHIIPNILTPVLVRFATDMATVIVIFSAVNFMFFREFTPFASIPELGSLIAGFPAFGFVYGPHGSGLPPTPFNPPTAETFLLFNDWWTVLFPIIFLVILIIGLISFSDGIRRAIDPRTNF